MSTQSEKAELFRSLHQPGNPVLLVNAWDAVSARIIESLGFPAVASTSAGVAFLEGFRDGEHIGRAGMLAGLARICRAVSVPVSADLEAGYGATPEDTAQTVRGAIETGAIGLNFEDATHDPTRLIDAQLQVQRIRAIRRAGDECGVPVVINARTDVFLNEIGAEEERLGEVLRRGRLYRNAGADCIFVPGVWDATTIEQLVIEMGAPVNILMNAKSPPLSELRRLGVGRISLGSGPMLAALAAFRDTALDLRDAGIVRSRKDPFTHAQINGLFREVVTD